MFQRGSVIIITKPDVTKIYLMMTLSPRFLPISRSKIAAWKLFKAIPPKQNPDEIDRLHSPIAARR